MNSQQIQVSRVAHADVGRHDVSRPGRRLVRADQFQVSGRPVAQFRADAFVGHGHARCGTPSR